MHNPKLLEDLARLVEAAATPESLPPFVPLGRWESGTGARMLVCDTSGAPHQSKLVPLHRTWSAGDLTLALGLGLALTLMHNPP